MFKERFISALLGSMFVIIFQPFGLIAFGKFRWVLFAGICVCIFFSIFFVELLLTWAFRMPHDPSRGMEYLVKRNMLFQVLNIVGMTVCTALFADRFCCMEGVDNHLSWLNMLYMFLIFSGSSLLIGLYWRNEYMKRDFRRQLEDAQYQNGILQERQRSEEHKAGVGIIPAEQKETNEDAGKEAGELTISGTTKESLTLLPQDFIYAESDGNYAHIHYRRGGEMKECMIRCSITQVEETMSIAADILRCHRAFVVNLSHVAKQETHGSTLQLLIKEAQVFVPVSKTYMPIIKERIVAPMK